MAEVRNEVEIRFLTADDAEAYYEVRAEALEREPEAFSSSLEEHRKLDLNEIRRRLAGDPVNNFVAGVFVSGKLSGTAGFHRETGPKTRHKGMIWGVYLAASLRGKGIGRRMMTFLLERASKVEGIDQIMISVSTTRAAARGLYRDLGFKPFGIEPNALKIGDRYIDEEYMVLQLTNHATRGEL